MFTSHDMNMGSREGRGGLGRHRTQAVGMDGRRAGPRRGGRGLGTLKDKKILKTSRYVHGSLTSN